MEKKKIEEIIKENYSMIYNLGLRLFNYRADDARDFAQDVFLQFFENYHKFKQQSKISTWLYSLALNLGLNKIKKLKRFHTQEVMLVQEPEPSFTNSYEIPGDDHLQEIGDLVRSELSDLPDTYRIPLILLYYEKLSYGEISHKLQIPEGTVKSLIYRGKILLRKKLEEHLQKQRSAYGTQNQKHME